MTLTRTYNSADGLMRRFGRSMTHPHAMFLWSAQQYQEADLILPDGGRLHFVRTSPGVGFTEAVFVHQESPTTSATPTSFSKAHMSWNGNGWDVRLIDGTVYVFGENAPLQAIRDRYGNTVTIAHASGQAGPVTQVTSPNGRWITFTYDPSNRITEAKDNLGRTVTSTYDANGNLATVTDPETHVTSYTYDDSHRLLTVKPPNLQGTQTHLVTNEYTTAADAPTPVGWVKKQTHVDDGVYQFAYTFQNGTIDQTRVGRIRTGGSSTDVLVQGGDIDGRPGHGAVYRRRWFVVGVLIGSAVVTASAEQQLTLGSVVLRLGDPDGPLVQELSKGYKVRPFEGGWSIQPLYPDPTAPAIGILTADHRIEGVSFIWGPGFTPKSEEIVEQLTQALPTDAQCMIRSRTSSHEGGTVRRVEWLCARYQVSLETGVYPRGGNTASIHIDRR